MTNKLRNDLIRSCVINIKKCEEKIKYGSDVAYNLEKIERYKKRIEDLKGEMDE